MIIKRSVTKIVLACVINHNGKSNKAISARLAPARKAMFGLKAKAIRLQLPPDIQIELFDKMIVPICLYGSEIWGCGKIDQLEIFYRKFIKRLLCLNKSTPNCIVYGEVGKVPLSNLVHQRMISFWINISEGKSTKLSSLIYKLIYKLHENGTYDSPWLLKIKTLLCHSGNPNFWYNQNDFVSKDFMKNIVFKQLDNQYLQEWNFEVQRNRKCTIYRILKEKHCFEQYLVKLSFVERMSLCKFRTGNHRLPIAESRYKPNIDVVCKLCDSGDICDEYHVLLKCKYFEEKRKLLLKKFYYNKPNTLKMQSLFYTTYKQLSNLAKFTKHIMSTF